MQSLCSGNPRQKESRNGLGPILFFVANPDGKRGGAPFFFLEAGSSLGPSLMANRFRKHKMEASTPSQACLPWETGESGPLGPTSYFGRGIQRRLPFVVGII